MYFFYLLTGILYLAIAHAHGWTRHQNDAHRQVFLCYLCLSLSHLVDFALSVQFEHRF